MKLFYCINLIFLFLSAVVGCGGSSAGSDKVQGLFSEIAALSVTCDSLDGGPASCNNTQQGKPVLLGWTSNSCASIDWSNLAAIETSYLFCVSGACMANDSVSWKSPSSGETVYSIGASNRTAVAWLNLVDNGAADNVQPQSGDVVCCQVEAAQHADIFANIQSDKCASVP